MSKIDFTQVIGVATRGGILRNPGSSKEQTLGKVCCVALNYWEPGKPIDRAEAKLQGDLARRINAAAGPINVISGDITMIKELLPLAWPPVVCSIAEDMLEGKAVDTGAEFETVEEAEGEGAPAKQQARKR